MTVSEQNWHEIEITFSKQFFKKYVFTEVLKGEKENQNLPSYVYKQVFCSFVNMEHLISKQSQARAALKCKFPKVQSCGITI